MSGREATEDAVMISGSHGQSAWPLPQRITGYCAGTCFPISVFQDRLSSRARESGLPNAVNASDQSPAHAEAHRHHNEGL
jgi:hypothetical protein